MPVLARTEEKQYWLGYTIDLVWDLMKTFYLFLRKITQSDNGKSVVAYFQKNYTLNDASNFSLNSSRKLFVNRNYIANTQSSDGSILV